MPKKIDNKTYPDTIATILKDKDFLEVFEDWAHKKERVTADMMMFIQTNMQTDRLYEHFLKKGARHPISVNATNRKAVEGLAAKEDWDHTIWKNLLIPNMRKDCITVLEKISIPNFWNSAEFKLHHNPDVKGQSRKVAQLLGVEDDGVLKDLMKATALNNTSEMNRLSKALMNNNKVKDRPKTFLGRLKKAMGL